MKTPGIYIGALAVFCIAALLIGTASAAAMTQQGSGNNQKDNTGQSGHVQMIERLKHQGVNVTEIKTAMRNGDIKTMKEWRQSCGEFFRGEMMKGAGKGNMTRLQKGTRLLLRLDNLTEQGYDVSAIRAAVENEDYKTAFTLMQEFKAANANAFPALGEGAGKGNLTRLQNGTRMLLRLDNLTEQGYDVSAIRAAVQNGDYKTAFTLMQEFKAANPEAFPALGKETGKSRFLSAVEGTE